jgi:hypothetical protein
VLREDKESARWDERVLSDGSRWKVFKRVFVPEELAEELEGPCSALEPVVRGGRLALTLRGLPPST